MRLEQTFVAWEPSKTLAAAEGTLTGLLGVLEPLAARDRAAGSRPGTGTCAASWKAGDPRLPRPLTWFFSSPKAKFRGRGLTGTLSRTAAIGGTQA